MVSHTTRAFIYNADALKGFLIKFDIISILRKADADGKLESIKKYQVFDFDAIELEL